MEGEGVSAGIAGAASSGVSAVSNAASAAGGVGSSFEGGGFEPIGSDLIGGTGSPVSIFEAGYQSVPGDAPALGIVEKEIIPIGEPVPIIDNDKAEVLRVESGIIDAVRKEGTPEAGFQFLSDVPIIGDDDFSEGDLSPAKQDALQNDTIERPELTPEQQQVHNFLRVNPEMLSAFGNMLSLGPEAMQVFLQALKKALEEEKQKAKDEEEKKKLNKWEVGFLAFLLLIQLAASAVEKGAKEATK